MKKLTATKPARVAISALIDEDLKAKLKEIAEVEHRTLTGQIEFFLARGVYTRAPELAEAGR